MHHKILSSKNFIYDNKMKFYFYKHHHECNICDNKGLYYTTKNHKNAVLEGVHIGGTCYKDINKDKVHIFIDPDFKVFIFEKISSYIEQLTDEDVTLSEELTIPSTIHYINLLVNYDIIRELYLNYLHSKETLKNNIIMSDINRITILIECETLYKPSEMSNDFYFVSIVADISQLIKKGSFSVNRDLENYELICKLSMSGNNAIGTPVCYFAIYKFEQPRIQNNPFKIKLIHESTI